MFLELLSPFQQEFKSWHKKSSNLHTKSIFILKKLGILPKNFLYLKADVTICSSYVFVIKRRQQRRTKGGKSGSIRK